MKATDLIYEYSAPLADTGDVLDCEAAGKSFVVGGITDAPIPWPRRRKSGRAQLIVCGDLVAALRVESASAIAHHWGVSITTVWSWRKALGVERVTEGTRELLKENSAKAYESGGPARGREQARSEESRRKMSETKRGKRAHPNTAKALREAAKQRKSASHRKKIGEANRRRRVEITCEICGERYLGKSATRKVCEFCEAQRARDHQRKHRAKKRAEQDRSES